MKQILYKLFEHQYLGRDEARTILQNIAQGKYNDVQVASLITVFLMRNISVEELCGFRDALLEMRIPVDLSEFAPIDIVEPEVMEKIHLIFLQLPVLLLPEPVSRL